MGRRVVLILVVLGVMALVAAPALAQYPPAAPTVAVSDATVVPGQPITVVGDGWEPGTEVVITWDDDQVLGTATVRADGTFELRVTIPADAAPGDHTLRVTGVGADGQPRTVTTVITVVAAEAAPAPAAPAPGVAATGSSLSLGALLALGLVSVGGLALFAARRKQRQLV